MEVWIVPIRLAQRRQYVERKQLVAVAVTELFLGRLNLNGLTDLGRRHAVDFEHAVDIAIGEVVNRASGLFEEGPEQHREERQDQHDVHPVPRDRLEAERLDAQVAEREQSADDQDQTRRAAGFRDHHRQDLHQRVVTRLELLDDTIGHNGDRQIVAGKRCESRDKQHEEGDRDQRCQIDGPFRRKDATHSMPQSGRIGRRAGFAGQASQAEGEHRHDSRRYKGDRDKHVDGDRERIVGTEGQQQAGCTAAPVRTAN